MSDSIDSTSCIYRGSCPLVHPLRTSFLDTPFMAVSIRRRTFKWKFRNMHFWCRWGWKWFDQLSFVLNCSRKHKIFWCTHVDTKKNLLLCLFHNRALSRTLKSNWWASVLPTCNSRVGACFKVLAEDDSLRLFLTPWAGCTQRWITVTDFSHRNRVF